MDIAGSLAKLPRPCSAPSVRPLRSALPSALRSSLHLPVPCQQHQQQRSSHTCHAAQARTSDGASTSAPSSSTSSSTSGADPFVAAGYRLQSLLAGAGNGEDELTTMMVEQVGPEEKLQFHVVVSAIVTVGAIVISSLCGKDPWGGASFSLESLGAAAIGAAASLPLVGAHLWSWTPQAARALPAVEDMHTTQREIARPWMSHMSAAHAFALMALETLPSTLFLYPALQGGLISSTVMYNSVLHSGLGVSVPEETAAVVAMLLTAMVAGLGSSLELDVEEEEYVTVEAAMTNSDRYYRLMAMDTQRGLPDAQRSARAFTAVAQAWIDTRGEACILAGTIAAVDVAYLGALWYGTGDLMAPAVAAMLINWVDTKNMHALVSQRELALAERSSRGGGGGGGGGSSKDGGGGGAGGAK